MRSVFRKICENRLFTAVFLWDGSEAELEEKARQELQEHLDAGNLSLDKESDWLLERDPDFTPDAIEENEFDLCIKCHPAT